MGEAEEPLGDKGRQAGQGPAPNSLVAFEKGAHKIAQRRQAAPHDSVALEVGDPQAEIAPGVAHAGIVEIDQARPVFGQHDLLVVEIAMKQAEFYSGARPGPGDLLSDLPSQVVGRFGEVGEQETQGPGQGAEFIG